MTKSWLSSFFCLFALFSLPIMAQQQQTGSQSIHWLTNFEQGMEEGRNSSKPILVFFTGEGWCTWCQKLEQEVLQRPEFASAIGNRFVFVKLDFPFSKKSDNFDLEKNKALQKQFDVRGFPTIIILSPNGQKLGTTGYKQLSPQEYASHLLNIAR